MFKKGNVWTQSLERDTGNWESSLMVLEVNDMFLSVDGMFWGEWHGDGIGWHSAGVGGMVVG